MRRAISTRPEAGLGIMLTRSGRITFSLASEVPIKPISRSLNSNPINCKSIAIKIKRNKHLIYKQNMRSSQVRSRSQTTLRLKHNFFKIHIIYSKVYLGHHFNQVKFNFNAF